MDYICFTTYLSVLELLLDIVDDALADFANEATIQQFGPDLARPSDRPADAHQLANPVRAQLADARDQRKAVKRDIELARLQVRTISGGGSWVDLEVLRFVFLDQIEHGATQVGEEAVVLILGDARCLISQQL